MRFFVLALLLMATPVKAEKTLQLVGTAPAPVLTVSCGHLAGGCDTQWIQPVTGGQWDLGTPHRYATPEMILQMTLPWFIEAAVNLSIGRAPPKAPWRSAFYQLPDGSIWEIRWPL